jgi:hypothetical protein
MKIDLSPVIKVVSSYAPVVGNAIAGPAGAIVGELVAHIFGGDISKPEELAQKIAEHPDASEKLIGLSYAHEEALENLRVKDVISAREMSENVVKITGKADWILNALAITYMVLFFVYVFIQQFHPISNDKGVFHDLLNGFTIILSFYFGSAYTQIKRK